jgi:Fanconi anemia group M protein
MDQKPKIICDHREQRSGVVKKLYELDAEIETAQLQVGDFILSNRVCVERKTVKDFLQSIIDNRLFNQISEMVANFEKPIIIVEGDEDIYAERAIHPNAIRGAIAALAIDFRIPIIQTACEHETALFLYTIASREQIDKKVSISLRGEKKPVDDSFLQEYIVCGFPGIGRSTAQNLLNHFKTIKSLVNADVKELTKVEKIGKKKAANIKRLVEKEYSNGSSDSGH